MGIGGTKFFADGMEQSAHGRRAPDHQSADAIDRGAAGVVES